MAGQRVAGHSKECRLPNKLTVTSKQALATAARLLQWKKHNAAKREVKARLQEDERIEEEEHFLTLSKALPAGQVQAAALRNYQAAGKLRWKKLVLQLIAEQKQLDEDEADCTFRPQLFARPRRLSTTASRWSTPCRSSCAAATVNSTDPPKAPSALRSRSRHPIAKNGDVFERLYKLQAVPATVSQTVRIAKRISSQAEAEFIARQERDQVNRQRRRSELAAQERYPHKPRLSSHTQEICAALRASETADHRQRQQKRSNPIKQARYTIPTCTNSVQSGFASMQFTSLIEALKQQEHRMRCMSKRAYAKNTNS